MSTVGATEIYAYRETLRLQPITSVKKRSAALAAGLLGMRERGPLSGPTSKWRPAKGREMPPRVETAAAIPLPPHTPLHQFLHLHRQIRSDPDDVRAVFLPCFFEPSVAVAVAAPQQRLQLREPVFKKIRRAGPFRGSGRVAAGCGRGTPGHNSISHLLCSFQEGCTSCGQTVGVCPHPGRRLLCPAFSIECALHQWPAARRSGHSSRRVVCDAFLAHCVGRRVTGASTLERGSAGGETECASNSRNAKVSLRRCKLPMRGR